jgi:hypothetical protein
MIPVQYRDLPDHPARGAGTPVIATEIAEEKEDNAA